MSRPNLDMITLWRGEQIARLEGRSLAGALAVLVQEAWNLRLNREAARCLGIHRDVPGEPGQTVASYLPVRIAQLLKRLSVSEHRSISAVVRLLVCEALAARGHAALFGQQTEADHGPHSDR